MPASDYCRELESYLCQKNEGHLIRIVGPVFEQVCGWAELGVPLAIAKKGIDRYCERYYAKGPRRRPVRIEFCEADILDLFDAWRRAVGVTAMPLSSAEPQLHDGQGGGGAQHRDSLPAHLDRAIARLTALRGGGGRSARFDDRIADAVRQLDTMRTAARRARGDERAELLERLAALDAALTSAALQEIDSATLQSLREEADAEVAPFAPRMTPEARAAAAAAAFERLVRDFTGLPGLTFV